MALLGRLDECAVVSGLPNKLGNFDPRTDRFVWTRGDIKLPPRFWRHVNTSEDTFSGVFVGTSDRRLNLIHDIGGYAGAYANPEGALRFEERSKDGARIWLAKKVVGPNDRRHLMMAVTFPDSGCANFFLKATDDRDWEIIDAIARSYRPRGEIRKSRCGR